jgi:RNA polymerase sigma-70 factor, ECF subfamily
MDAQQHREQDAGIVRRVMAGEPGAYRHLVAKYQTKVCRVVENMVGDSDAAREIAQDAFIHTYRGLDRFRGDTSFYTHLYRIAVNKAIGYRRRIAQDSEDSTPSPSRALERPEPSEGRRLKRGELRYRTDAAYSIDAALAKLPSDQETTIRLREIDGLTYVEIAQAMDCAEGTVMSRLFYGRKKLQDILREQARSPTDS